MSIVFLLGGLLLFVLIVVIHEYGHFLAAKLNGVEVEEFGIGFPPRIYGRKLGKGIFEGYYSINVLPLGGFNKLKGENAADTRPGSFGAASFPQQAAIIMAGVALNFITGIVLLSVVAAIALPVVVEDQFSVASDSQIVEQRVDITAVESDSPAASANLAPGDVIIAIEGELVQTTKQVGERIAARAGQETTLTIDRVESEDAELINLTPRQDPEDGESYIGVGLQEFETRRATWSAPVVGAVVSWQIVVETLSQLGQMVANIFSGDVATATQGVAGPVGIVYIFTQIDSVGLLLFVGAIISLGLGLINALPIPALDGGRLAVTGLFKLMNKPLSENVENAIHGTGMALLLTLITLITIIDVQRIFS